MRNKTVTTLLLLDDLRLCTAVKPAPIVLGESFISSTNTTVGSNDLIVNYICTYNFGSVTAAFLLLTGAAHPAEINNADGTDVVSQIQKIVR